MTGGLCTRFADLVCLGEQTARFVGLLQAEHAVKKRSYPGMLAARGSFKVLHNFISSVPLAWPEEDATLQAGSPAACLRDTEIKRQGANTAPSPGLSRFHCRACGQGLSPVQQCPESKGRHGLQQHPSAKPHGTARATRTCRRRTRLTAVPAIRHPHSTPTPVPSYSALDSRQGRPMPSSALPSAAGPTTNPATQATCSPTSRGIRRS